MDGELFRKLASNAFDTCARFLDEFPECDISLTVSGKFGAVSISIDSAGTEDEDDPMVRRYEDALMKIAAGAESPEEIANKVLYHYDEDDEEAGGDVRREP